MRIKSQFHAHTCKIPYLEKIPPPVSLHNPEMPFPVSRYIPIKAERIKYWPEAVMCCRTLYSHPCGVAAVKNTLFAVKHVFAAHPDAHDTRTSSAGLVACYIERENKGLSRMESFLFLGMIFQHSTKSFPFGVLGWPRTEWAIKLMNGRFHSFAEKKNKRRAF